MVWKTPTIEESHRIAGRIAALLREEKDLNAAAVLALAEVAAGALVANYPERIRAETYEAFLGALAEYMRFFEKNGIVKE